MSLSPPTRSPRERLALRLCLLFLFVFCANVVFGRLSVTQGWSNAWTLDRVTEFFLLAATAVSFAAASLYAENRDEQSNADQSPTP